MKLKRNSITILLTVGFMAILSGCASKDIRPVSSTDAQELSSKTFTFVQRETPAEANVITPGKAVTMGLFGAVGGAVVGAIDASKAKKVFKDTPAYHINSKLSPALTKKYKVQFISSEEVTDEDDIEELVKVYKNVDYLVDTFDIQWMVLYFPMNWDTYGIRYFGNIKLIDVKNKKVIAQGYCEHIPEYSDKAPDYDTLFANNGKLLNKMTENILNVCAQKYLKEVF